jgi:hypothetical protein
MSSHDTDSTLVLETLKDSLDGVTMHTPLDRIVSEGRARRRRRRLVSGAAGLAAASAVALGVPALSHSSSPSAGTALSTGTGSTNIRTVAFTLSKRADGTIHVSWDKERYFNDRDGLAKALTDAGLPVVIKEGQFCAGPDDDLSLSPTGSGPGVSKVMHGVDADHGKVDLVFTPSAMPAGKQLFIGYLSAAQLAVTHGAPGSVERLISTGVPLTCTTTAPPAHPGRGGSKGTDPKAGANKPGAGKPGADKPGADKSGPTGSGRAKSGPAKIDPKQVKPAA